MKNEKRNISIVNNKLQLTLLLALLVFSLVGCMPSFDPEAEKQFNQGIEYVRQSNNDLAIEQFTNAINIDPEYYYAYYNRALAYYRTGNLESSLTDYNKAIELYPNNVYWTIERGYLNLELGDREKALADFERAQELGLPYEYSKQVNELLTELRP